MNESLNVYSDKDYLDGKWYVVDDERFFINGCAWMYKRTRDAFYVQYQDSTGVDAEAVWEPSETDLIDSIPDSKNIRACVEFGYGLVTEEQSE